MKKLGRYEVLEELGRGAMGTVFLARDPVIDRSVAIKTILASAAGTESRRLGVFRRVEGSYSTTLQVPIGRRTVRVRVTSSEENYDQTREIAAEFAQGQEKTLYATCDSRCSSLTLSLR